MFLEVGVEARVGLPRYSDKTVELSELFKTFATFEFGGVELSRVFVSLF